MAEDFTADVLGRHPTCREPRSPVRAIRGSGARSTELRSRDSVAEQVVGDLHRRPALHARELLDYCGQLDDEIGDKLLEPCIAKPKSAHPGAKKALAEIRNAEDRPHALDAATVSARQLESPGD